MKKEFSTTTHFYFTHGLNSTIDGVFGVVGENIGVGKHTQHFLSPTERKEFLSECNEPRNSREGNLSTVQPLNRSTNDTVNGGIHVCQ